MTRSILISILSLLFGIKANAQMSFDTSAKSKQTIYPFQVSVIPPLSTNGAGNVFSINECSLNLLAGYSGGVNGFELGGFANIVKGNVNGFQIAGFTNITSGPMQGGQIAGFCNVNQQRITGFQLAGFTNVVNDSMDGSQLAGFCNINTGTTTGWQLAGFMNQSRRKLDGLQAAGFLNVVTDTVHGAQLAGFSNVAVKEVSGVQLAGFINTSQKNLCGAQIAGFINTADTVNGAQVAGFMNVSRLLNGSQLGVFNFTDSLESGTPVGFLSFVRKGGYYALEATSNETFYLGIQFKTGSNRFYNILNLGVLPEKELYWGFGYGIGTGLKNDGKFRVNIDLFSMQVSEQSSWANYLNLLNKLQLGLTWQMSKRIGFTAGPTFNVLVVHKKTPELTGMEKTIAPENPVFDHVYNGDTRVQMWPGIHAAFRF